MLMDLKLTDIFWIQAMHTTIHIQNRVMLKKNTEKTPYELWKERPANVNWKKMLHQKRRWKNEKV